MPGDDACANPPCAHRACWIQEAHVTELTGLLREGPAGDQLASWLAPMAHEPARGHQGLAGPELHHYVHSSNFSASTWQNTGNMVLCAGW